jgi:ferrous iron transport protein B
METIIALAGNPNSGKTTLFNLLTGAHQHVGNYPGVTVEKKQGVCVFKDQKFQIVDLPGAYSLSPYSLEETVARDFLVLEKPSMIINIVDASNLERNLFLSLQFLEMGFPMCIALNMMDVAKGRGIQIDQQKLSTFLNIPVIPMVARSGAGKEQLMQSALKLSEKLSNKEPLNFSYGPDIDQALLKMQTLMEENEFLIENLPSRWLALKYLEGDNQVKKLGHQCNPDVSSLLEKISRELSDHLDRSMETTAEAVIGEYRYGFIRSLIAQGVVQIDSDRKPFYFSDRLDRVLTHRIFGPIFMAAALLGLYHFTFNFSQAPVEWLEKAFEYIRHIADVGLSEGPLKSLLISGIIDGAGGVFSFVPLIMLMFLGIALLEDSGYLARVAFMLDRVFRFFGLHGNSVVAYIISGGIAGGCAVPGIMATRTLKSPKERLATMLTLPFMNCGAKLPVFAVLIAAFFADHRTTVMMMVTVAAWLVALFAARLFRSTILPGKAAPFVMELPPYHLPTPKGLIIHMWERTWQYLKKAGPVILAISIILWAMMSYPRLPVDSRQAFEMQRQHTLSAFSSEVIHELSISNDTENFSIAASSLQEQLDIIDAREAEESLKYSVAGQIGTAFEKLSIYAGFDWRVNIALVGGVAAKEVIVSTMGTAYSLGNADMEENGRLSSRLQAAPGFNSLTAISLIVFIMFYSPCFVSVVCICRESGSWKWGFFSMVFNTVLAFLIAVTVYQVGLYFGY